MARPGSLPEYNFSRIIIASTNWIILLSFLKAKLVLYNKGTGLQAVNGGECLRKKCRKKRKTPQNTTYLCSKAR
ncbi:hypothetical protein MSHOH_0921 [Methanosarcina horonobensis HB-1 = JCM 15518]|uniref:Uncharacterized protein n=1 Tax=Methanosarcina horonobensis HB-1 = JCM 15518 TaxID=1434110 RepID=A0A0E3S7N0_9EURY|nr:hypothetical protein [Methanosarcina horonobensis]AKB77404.1 hypothetical protein MSHOH_0921 [Methanosarcina horonobensis HB-1 = JCM 15518]